MTTIAGKTAIITGGGSGIGEGAALALGIRVNAICPGMVVTEMSQNAPGLNKERCLYPEDIADLILFLLTRRLNVKIGRPILIQTTLNPWEA